MSDDVPRQPMDFYTCQFKTSKLERLIISAFITSSFKGISKLKNVRASILFFCNYWQLLELLDCVILVHYLPHNCSIDSGVILVYNSLVEPFFLHCLIDHYVIAWIYLIKESLKFNKSCKLKNYCISSCNDLLIFLPFFAIFFNVQKYNMQKSYLVLFAIRNF